MGPKMGPTKENYDTDNESDLKTMPPEASRNSRPSTCKDTRKKGRNNGWKNEEKTPGKKMGRKVERKMRRTKRGRRDERKRRRLARSVAPWARGPVISLSETFRNIEILVHSNVLYYFQVLHTAINFPNVFIYLHSHVSLDTSSCH